MLIVGTDENEIINIVTMLKSSFIKVLMISHQQLLKSVIMEITNAPMMTPVPEGTVVTTGGRFVKILVLAS